MTPAARCAAAIDVLAAIADGAAIEAALLRWARGNRYAGSKDRAAVRDIVFSIQRRRASCAAMGSPDPEGLLRGYLAQEGVDERDVFGAGAYAPAALPVDATPVRPFDALSDAERADVQPWVWRAFQAQYTDAADIAEALRHRAPVWVRVNLQKASRPQALAALSAAGHAPVESDLCRTALRITALQRQLAQHALVKDGTLEFQDLAAQRACETLPGEAGTRVLDFCAGGGGKSLALAARGMKVSAYDADFARMSDLPARVRRAGVSVERLAAPEGRFDLVVCDVPCSGSGAWRRAVEGKWSLSEADLARLVDVQRGIVSRAIKHVKPGGTLAYMTCSLLEAENAQQAAWISAEFTGIRAITGKTLTPLEGGDGFFWSLFRVNCT